MHMTWDIPNRYPHGVELSRTVKEAHRWQSLQLGQVAQQAEAQGKKTTG